MAAPGDAPPPTPRTDLYIAAGFLAFGVAIIAGSAAMPTFTSQGTPIYVAPGLVPGFHGVVITVLALLLAARSVSRGAMGAAGSDRSLPERMAWRRSVGRIALATALTLVFAVGLIGRVPFWLAAALFIFVFIMAFEWRAGQPRAVLARNAIWAFGIAVIAGWAVTLLFENLFLIRMP
jgi:putative tricarboxylic transport membrane protein